MEEDYTPMEANMEAGYTATDMLRADIWYRAHKTHVNRLMKIDGQAYPASGSDIGNPELWKPEHWRWFLKQIKSVRAHARFKAP